MPSDLLIDLPDGGAVQGDTLLYGLLDPSGTPIDVNHTFAQLQAFTSGNFYQAFDSVGGTNPNNVVPVALPFDNTEEAQSWITDTSDTVKTIDENGKYVLGFEVSLEKTTGNNTTIEFDIFKNGILLTTHSVIKEIRGNDFNSYPSIQRGLDLVATDTIEVRGFRLLGNTNTTTILANATRLTIFKVG